MKRFAILLCCLLCASCAGRLPSPDVEAPVAYTYAGSFSTDTLDVGISWWERFGDTVLNDLIARAIARNKEIASAASRVEQARLNLGVVRSAYLPTFAFGLSGEGEYTSRTKITQEYVIQPSVEWEISLFGSLGNATKAARAQILASKWAYRGVMLSVAAQVATTYFTLLRYERSLDIARRTYKLRSETVTIIDSMFRYGMSSGVDLQQARSLAAAAAIDIPQYERAVIQTALSLNILLGENPETNDFSRLPWRLSVDHLPADVPVGLPSELLQRRPDVMEAYFRVQQSAAQVGIARAARFPSIALTGEGGVASTTLKGLTSSKPWAWTALGKLSQPLFSFGALRRRERIARESYNQSLLDYEQTVLEAFSDVETALSAIETYGRQAQRYASMLVANEDIRYMTGQLYLNGLNSFLDVIDAERTLYASQLNYIEVVTEQYISYVSLYKALGGGW